MADQTPEGPVAPKKEDDPGNTLRSGPGCRTVAFVFFAVIIPVLAILTELASHQLADMFIDPIPTGSHVLLLFLVPVCLALCELHLFRESRNIPRLYTTVALGMNACATVVSLGYFIAFLPFMPMALLGIIACGLGLLPMSPFFCTAGGLFQMRRLYIEGRRAGLSFRGMVGRTLAGGSVACLWMGVLVVVPVVTERAITLAFSENPEERSRGISLLRKYGSEDTVLERCYGVIPKRGPWRTLFGPSGVGTGGRNGYRELYFRLTGTPFNAVPPPDSRAMDIAGPGWRDTWLEEQVVQDEIGGEAVAGRIKGLHLASSTMEVEMESHAGTAGPGVATLEWMMAFKNTTRLQQEARAQILLPHDAVASRLTLWIGGEERRAAFGTRGQVRKAYREVAVVQRRDPALLTTTGSDRVLLQCFPVLPGEVLKTRVGIAAPLVVRGGTAYLRLPRFAERNFTIGKSFHHDLWVECGVKPGSGMTPLPTSSPQGGVHTLRSRLTEAALQDPGRSTLTLPAPPRTATFEASLGLATARAAWRGRPAAASGAVCLVVDGSRTMARTRADWTAFCEALPDACSINAVFAGQKVEVWRDGFVAASREAGEELAQWISGRVFLGGCDATPALEAAWDRVSAEPAGVVVWVHGALPVLLSPVEGLKMRLERRPETRVLSVSVAPGPNRVVENLGDLAGFVEAPVLDSVEKTLAYVGGHLAPADAALDFQLALNGEGFDPVAKGPVPVSDMLVRLAVHDRVRTLCRKGGEADLTAAATLAVHMRLVTPVSGAVVLETREQYERNDLDPYAGDATESIPGIPEPEEWALLLVAVVGFAVLWMRRRAARQAAGGAGA